MVSYMQQVLAEWMGIAIKLSIKDTDLVTGHTTSQQAGRRSYSKDDPALLRHQNDNYHVHKGTLPISAFSHLNPVYTPENYFIKIHTNIIIQSMPRSREFYIYFFGLTSKIV